MQSERLGHYRPNEMMCESPKPTNEVGVEEGGVKGSVWMGSQIMR
jgi:hypothetical protein